MTLQPIVKEINLKATPERVFDAYTVAERLQEWFAMRAQVDLDQGTWTFDWPPYLQARGRWLTVERPNRLVWTWDESIQDSRVGPDSAHAHPSVTMDYTFTDNGDGTTHFRLEERGHGTPEVREMNAAGIETMLTGLRAYLEENQTVDWAALPPNDSQ